MVGKLLKSYEGVSNKEKVQTSPFRKVIEISFNFLFKNKDEGNDNMQKLVKLFMSSLYIENILQDVRDN